ncbi:uncharacterized protein LOC105641400 [Jatropha curcas]|uniref:uncharacterized protein LOC105641400 n=1 Tax=Jatropha curcas TaxID=180498 RepID=UPI0005FC2BC4|nr:uncharacterized protein LOC105641400 [Jatropha curcas]
MKAYLPAMSLWEVVETDEEQPQLRESRTIAQLKKHEDDLTKKPKALTCIHLVVSKAIFYRIVACETPKEAWDKLKEVFEGNNRVKAVKLLTLKREFKMLKMKEEKFEAKISTIKESCDLKTLSIVELISKFQAQEQRTSIRNEEVSETTFRVKHIGKRITTSNHCTIVTFATEMGTQRTTAEINKEIEFTTATSTSTTKFIGGDDQNRDKECFMTSHLRHKYDKFTWLSDSGCTSHMAKEESIFSSLDKSFKNSVKMADGRR